MKFFAFFLLAVCLIHGNDAQFNALRNAVSSAVGTASNFASGTVQRMTSGTKGVIDTASNALNADTITKTAKDMTPDQLLETIKSVETQVSDLVKKATDSITETVKSAATGPLASTECAQKKVTEAATLTKNIAELVPRAAVLTKDGIVGYHTCSQKTNFISKNSCKAVKLVPVAVKAAILLKDTISYTSQAIKTVTTINTSIAECAKKMTSG